MELRVLQDHSDPLLERPRSRRRIVAEDRDLATVAAAVALQDLDGRRLPRAVRAEETEHFAFPDLEADSAESLDSVVGLAEIAYDDRVGHQASTVISATPAGGNPGSAPVSSSAISEQSGW